MLGKLIKYEFSATKRIMFPAMLALICVSVINGLLIGMASNNIIQDSMIYKIFSVLSGSIYFIGIIAILILAAVLSIIRFYKSDLSNEGYLTHTLPINISSEIISKVTMGTLWVILTGVAIFISFILLFVFASFFNFTSLDFSDFILNLKRVFSVHGEDLVKVFLFMLYLFVIIVLGCANKILSVYASMAVGFSYNKNKILLSFVAYIAISVLTTLFVMLLGIFVANPFYNLLNLSVSPFAMGNLVFIGLIVLLAILNVIYFYIVKFFFERKLNLE